MPIREFVTVLAVVGSCACSDKERSQSGMYCFEFPKTRLIGDLHVRKPHPGSRDLVVGRGGARFYDHEKKTLTLVEPSRWKEAKGVVTDYSSWGTLDEDVIPGEINLKLMLVYKKKGNRQIPTKGAWVTRVSSSFEGKLFAALTRDEEPKKGMKEPSAHYVELFTYPEGKPVGKPYELPFTDFNNIEPLCWSSGDTYLVVSTEVGKHICIIEVPDLKEE